MDIKNEFNSLLDDYKKILELKDQLLDKLKSNQFDDLKQSITELDLIETKLARNDLEPLQKSEYFTQILEFLNKAITYNNNANLQTFIRIKIEETKHQLYLLEKTQTRYDRALKYLIQSSHQMKQNFDSFDEYLNTMGQFYLQIDYEINVNQNEDQINISINHLLQLLKDLYPLIQSLELNGNFNIILVDQKELLTNYQIQRFLSNIYAISQIMQSELVDESSKYLYFSQLSQIRQILLLNEPDFIYTFDMALAITAAACEQYEQALVGFSKTRKIALEKYNQKQFYELLECSISIQQIYLEIEEYKQGLKISLEDLTLFEQNDYEIKKHYNFEYKQFKQNLSFFYLALGDEKSAQDYL